MADSKISALTAQTAATATDILPIVDDIGGTPTTKKITFANLESSLTLANQVGAPTGTIVGTTDTQSLTNKTLTDGTNNVMAKSLKSATTTIDVSAATAPTAGQVLMATSGTAATWQNPAGGGDALTSQPLSQFAATTSAQLAGVLSDETGTGSAVFGTSPTIATPTLTLKQGAAPAPTAEGDIQWDTDDNKIVVGDGVGTKTFSDDSVNAATYQPLDSDLTTIAGLTATSDNFIQSKSSAWASRTPTQVTADLIAMVGDSGSGGTKGLVPAPSAGDAAAGKYLKADGTWTAIAAGGQTLYDAIVAPSGGDYTTLGAALTAGATTIFVREGTYSESAITSATNNLMIVGESPNAAIIAMGANAASFSGTDVTFANLKITMSTGSFNSSGARSRLLDCNIAPTGTNNQIMDFGGDASTVMGCKFIDGAASFSGSNRLTIRGLYTKFVNNYVYLRHGSTGTEFVSEEQVVTGNTFRRHTANANNYIVKLSAPSISCTGNSFYVYNSSDRVLGVGSSGCVVTGNTFAGFGARAIDIDGNGNTISGNSFYSGGYGLCGVYLQNDRNLVKGNNFTGQGTGTTTWLGVEIIDGRNYNVVDGNNFYNWYTGVKLSGTTSIGNVVTNNHFHPATFTTAIVDGGLRTNIFGNTGLDTTLTEKRFVRMKNTSGGSVAVGDVVVWKAVANGDEVTTTTTAGDDKVFGMVAEAVADNTYCYVQTLGKTTLLKVDGTTDIAIGDPLTTFTTAKIAYKASAGDMVFAYALEAYTANDSNGVIDALLITPRLI